MARKTKPLTPEEEQRRDVAIGLVDEMESPKYETMDLEDVEYFVFGEVVDVLKDLETVDVTDALKQQAAFHVGQTMLYGFAWTDARKTAATDAAIVSAALIDGGFENFAVGAQIQGPDRSEVING